MNKRIPPPPKNKNTRNTKKKKKKTVKKQASPLIVEQGAVRSVAHEKLPELMKPESERVVQGGVTTVLE